MKYIADLISDITDNFYGGVSHNVNYHNLVKRAFDEASHKANSSTLLTLTGLYHGIIRDDYNSFVLPESTNKIAEVFYNGIQYNRKPLTKNNLDQDYNFSLVDTIRDFTIISVSLPVSHIYTVLDEFEDENSFIEDTETSTLEKPVNYYINKNGGIATTFSADKQKITKDLDISVDLLQDNIIVMPVYFNDITKDILYRNFDVTLTGENGEEKVFRTQLTDVENGWNMFEFELDDVDFDIKNIKISSDLENDEKLDFVIERTIITQPNNDYIKYYSNKFVIDKETRKGKELSSSNSDALNLSNKFYQAMIYEGSIILGFQVTDRVKHRYDSLYFEDKLEKIYREIGDNNLLIESYDYKDDLMS